MITLKQVDEQSITTGQAVSQLTVSRTPPFRWLACYRKDDFSFLEHLIKAKELLNTFPTPLKQQLKIENQIIVL